MLAIIGEQTVIALITLSGVLITAGLVPIMIKKNTDQHQAGSDDRAGQKVLLEEILNRQRGHSADIHTVKTDILAIKTDIVGVKTEVLEAEQRRMQMLEEYKIILRKAFKDE